MLNACNFSVPKEGLQGFRLPIKRVPNQEQETSLRLTILWDKAVNAGIVGDIERLPCRTKRTPEGIEDARTGAVDWNKGTGAQVDFVEPETWVLNHQLQGRRDEADSPIGNTSNHLLSRSSKVLSDG